MSSVDSGSDQSDRSALGRVISFARRGQAQYNRGAAALSHWLRGHLLRQSGESDQPGSGRSLWRFFAARRVRERQEVYRRGGGGHSSAAAHARRRVAKAFDGKEE